MAITLAAVPPAGSLAMQAVVLGVVGIGITVAVYGVVAMIVKADDVGGPRLQGAVGPPLSINHAAASDEALVIGMPGFLTFLSAVGTAAIIWVGGGIIVHGLETYDLHALGHAIHAAAEVAGRALPSVAGVAKWTVETLLYGLVGLLIGGISIPVIGFALAPAWKS